MGAAVGDQHGREKGRRGGGGGKGLRLRADDDGLNNARRGWIGGGHGQHAPHEGAAAVGGRARRGGGGGRGGCCRFVGSGGCAIDGCRARSSFLIVSAECSPRPRRAGCDHQLRRNNRC